MCMSTQGWGGLYVYARRIRWLNEEEEEDGDADRDTAGSTS